MIGSKCLFVLIFICIRTISCVEIVGNVTCAVNEEFTLCGTACPANCTTPRAPVNCADDCIEGCVCKGGYLKNDNGTCVPFDECGTNASICAENEEFLSCGSACPLTCLQPLIPLTCGVVCSFGCFCKNGYVRDETSNLCVTVEECPTEQCFNENEVYDVCNASCESSCRDPSPICAHVCKGGCICGPGFSRHDNGTCILSEMCPNIEELGMFEKYMNAIKRILNL